MASSFEVCLDGYKHSFVPDLLKGKVAFITGGGSGIGFTITEILMRHGCHTAIASRRLDKLEDSAQKLEKATGGKCLPITMDVRKPQMIMEAVDKVLAHYGKIDILVNNAAGNFLAPLSGMSYNAFKTVIDIDTVGTFNVSKAVFDKYFNEHGGNIINITATLHYKGQVLQAHAGAAKAAIDALTKHMAVEWGPLGIRVNGIAPGPIGGTEGMSRLGGADMDRRMEHLKEMMPIGRMGRKDEIAHLLLYLVSELGGLITGQTIVADGGNWLAAGNSMSEAVSRMSSYMKKSKM